MADDDADPSVRGSREQISIQVAVPALTHAISRLVPEAAIPRFNFPNVSAQSIQTMGEIVMTALRPSVDAMQQMTATQGSAAIAASDALRTYADRVNAIPVKTFADWANELPVKTFADRANAAFGPRPVDYDMTALQSIGGSILAIINRSRMVPQIDMALVDQLVVAASADLGAVLSSPSSEAVAPSGDIKRTLAFVLLLLAAVLWAGSAARSINQHHYSAAANALGDAAIALVAMIGFQSTLRND